MDPTGKAAGRGAYLCPDAACVALALKKSALERALRASVPPDIRAALEAVAAHPNSLAARPPAPAEQTG